jgi:hypothetical protein
MGNPSQNHETHPTPMGQSAKKSWGPHFPTQKKQISTTQNNTPKHQQFQQDKSIGRTDTIQKHMLYVYITWGPGRELEILRCCWGGPMWAPLTIGAGTCAWGVAKCCWLSLASLRWTPHLLIDNLVPEGWAPQFIKGNPRHQGAPVGAQSHRN